MATAHPCSSRTPGPRERGRFSTLFALGLIAAASAACAAAPAAPAEAQERERDVRQEEVRRDRVERALQQRSQERRTDCRCVDADGEKIENCHCFRMPDFDDMPQMTGLRQLRGFAGSWSAFGGSRAWIGVGVDAGQDDAYEGRGVHLEEVVEGSPAWDAGLRSGDLVTAVEGRSVFEALRDGSLEDGIDLDASVPVQRFLAMIRELEPGEEVRIDYRRDGEDRVATVTPEERPGHRVFSVRGRAPDAPLAFSFDGDSPRVFHFRDGAGPEIRARVLEGMERLPRGELRIGAGDPCFGGPGGAGTVRIFMGDGCVDGLHLQELNPELGSYFGGDDGILVTEIEEGTSLGIEAGDVILRIGDREVTDPDDVRRILRSYGPDEDVVVTVRRRGELREIQGTRRPPM